MPNKQRLYLEAAGHAIEAIQVLAKEMVDGDSGSTRVGAAKALLSKCLPDLRSAELTGKDGETLTFIIKRKID